MSVKPGELTDDIQLEMFRSFGGNPGIIVKSIFSRQPRIVITGNGHFNEVILVFEFRVYTEVGEESLELKGTATGITILNL